MTRTLLVTADDFGLTVGVNRAIITAHRDGIVTSASVLAVARSYRHAIDLAAGAPALSLGVHLAAVGEDPPLLGAAEVPTLVDRRGGFPLSYRDVLWRAATGRLDIDDVRREFRAQIERVRGDGVSVTHLDTHQHLHLWPTIARVVVELATEFAIPAVRLPRSHRATPLGLGVNALAALLRRRLDVAGLLRCADFAGLDEAGQMDRHLAEAVARLGRGDAATVELNVHPGEADDVELGRFAWGYRWDAELAALVDPGSREGVRAAGFRLSSWSELARPAGAAG